MLPQRVCVCVCVACLCTYRSVCVCVFVYLGYKQSTQRVGGGEGVAYINRVDMFMRVAYYDLQSDGVLLSSFNVNVLRLHPSQTQTPRHYPQNVPPFRSFPFPTCQRLVAARRVRGQPPQAPPPSW